MIRSAIVVTRSGGSIEMCGGSLLTLSESVAGQSAEREEERRDGQ